MSPTTRHVKKYKARQRPRLQAHERLACDRHQAQYAAEALHQALDDLGLPEELVPEIEGRLRSQQQLLGKIVEVMFPALFGCRTPAELCRVRGWDKNWPSRLLRALPKCSWLKRLRRLAREVLLTVWRHVEIKSPAAQSRWQWTWATDQRTRPVCGRMALAGAPVGAACTLCAVASHQPHLWGRDTDHCRRTG